MKTLFFKTVPQNNILILSEQSERFNFSPQATHPASNVIVLRALIIAIWLRTQYLMRDYLLVINCRLRKKRKTVPKVPFLTRKPPFLGPFLQKKNAKLSHAPLKSKI